MAKRKLNAEKKQVLSDLLQQGLLGQSPSADLMSGIKRRFKRKGAEGVQKFINQQRRTLGLGNIEAQKKDNGRFGIRRVLGAIPLNEQVAYAGTRGDVAPAFDEMGRKQEISDEFSPYYNQETADLLRQQYGRSAEQLDIQEQQGNEDFATEEGKINQAERYGGEDYSTRQKRLEDIKSDALKQRGYTEQNENIGQNVSFGNRGIDTLSPTAQKLAQRLRDQQAFRAQSQDRGFLEQGQDISTGQSRLAEQIAEQRRLLAQGRSRFGGGIVAQRRYLNEDQALFEKQRKQGLQERIAQQLDRERSQFLNT